MDMVIWWIIGGGALSIVYGVWAAGSVMSSDAGNARMQEIVTTNTVVGPSAGHVTSRNRSHALLAPSISAAW